MKAEFPVLSVYLGSGGRQTPYATDFISQLHSLAHQNLEDVEQRKWKKDLERIEMYLRESFDRENKRSVVFFSSGKNMWQVLEFEFFLPPQLLVSDSAYLKPLEKAIKEHQKYLVMLVDREKARLFTVHLGKIEKHKDIFVGEVPQKVKAKKIQYGREDKIFRHIEDHLDQHLELVCQKVKDFIKGREIHFIIIGSHQELLPKIKKRLKFPLNKIVRGEFVTELNIPLNEVLLHSKKIAAKIITK